MRITFIFVKNPGSKQSGATALRPDYWHISMSIDLHLRMHLCNQYYNQSESHFADS